MANSTRATSLYLPVSNYGSQSEFSFYSNPSEKPPVNPQVLRSLSPEDVQKMKYKIALDKQVAEKQQRITREWERKIERDKKYVQHQPFGRHEHTTVLKKEELEEILTKGRAPSPVLEMPQQYVLHHPPPPPPILSPSSQPVLQQQQQPFMTEPYIPNDSNPSNVFGSPRQPMYNNYSQYPTYSTTQPQAQLQPPNNSSINTNTTTTNNNNNNNPDFQRFYGPNGNSNPPNTNVTQGSIGTAQPIKGDAHDPFLLFDPNKEAQNVFNTIPQQDLYDPWGRPGAGAPLIHAPTGQKFTRYSGSLQEKLNHVGPLGFYGKQYTGNIEEQKRELELEQRRRQQEEMEHRSNAGDTAEWITQLERTRYPLKLHLPTTEPTREFTGARTRYRSEESRLLHDDLVQQAEERARLQKLNRYHNSIAELQHSEAMNNWWGKSGGGAPSFTHRRHNVNNTFENPRQKWTRNHLGQLVMADDEVPSQVKVQTTDYFNPKSKQLSNHRNYYQVADDQAS
ncbi:unnamed protein product [Rotaria sp. Silwood1]|nr:unnamed protein product [Rotaria sp. Silwood1]CAF1054246.1 unnamed protein product [Rotaria sp. Silwood1]CAF1159527.1 unnamed protein product [Rotaria sp. Silwood1]CAF3497242.1 unnamed protein product [Rotaria sp. Silwood1]CAF4684778.1 unnamed protein product [Rotaria sp. Silwood1]